MNYVKQVFCILQKMENQTKRKKFLLNLIIRFQKTYRKCYLGKFLDENKKDKIDEEYGTEMCVVKIPKNNSYAL